MRWLIGVYLAFGALQLVLSAVIAAFGVRSLTAGAHRRGGTGGGEEALLIAAIEALAAGVPLLAAYGLWRRWRVARLVLLGLSWWSLGVSALAVAAAVASLAGLASGLGLGFDDPPGQTFATAAGLAAFASWQAWVLLRPEVRQSFQRPPNPPLHPPAAD